MSKNDDTLVSRGAPVGPGQVVPEGESGSPHPMKWEISLKYLHKKRSDFWKLQKGALKKMSELIDRGQRGGPDCLMRPYKGEIIGEEKIRGWKNVFPLYPNDESVGKCVYFRLNRKSRILFAIAESDNSGGKLYMLAVDPNHEIAT